MIASAQKSIKRETLLLLVAWAAVVSAFITGYLGQQGATLVFSLVLVHKLNNPDSYPNDPFAETGYSYASVYWYLVAGLARVLDLEHVLLALFIVVRLALAGAALWLGRIMFPNSHKAWIAALLAIAAVPTPVVGNGDPIKPFAEQTTTSVVALLFSLGAFLQRRWWLSAFCFGLSLSLNLMYALFGATYLLGFTLAAKEYRLAWREWLPAALGALLIGAPGIYLVAQAALRPVAEPQAVWQAAELGFTLHFFIDLYPIALHGLLLIFAATTLFVAQRTHFVNPQTRVFITIATVIALSWYVIAWLVATVLPSISVLRLHPIRGTDLWVILATLFLAGVVGQRLETIGISSMGAFMREFALLSGAILWHVLGQQSLRRILWFAAAMLTGLAFAAGVAVYRRMRQQEIQPATLVLVAVAIGLTIAAGVRQVTVARGVLAMTDYGIVEHFAQWARQNTPPDTVFLIPLDMMAAAPTNDASVLAPQQAQVRWSNFRHLSQRNVFVTWLDAMTWLHAPWYSAEWLRRMRALSFFKATGISEPYRWRHWAKPPQQMRQLCEQAYRHLTDADVERLCRDYRIDYWIVPADKSTKFSTVYEYGGWKVLQVPCSRGVQ